MNTFETNMRDAPSAASGDAPKNKVYYIADVEGTIASYNPNYILRKLPGEDPYKMALPSAAGTLALVSDIEAVSGGIYEEIDEIKNNYSELRTDADEMSGKVDALEDIVSGTGVAHLGGTETFTGEKTFSNPILVGDDEAGLSVTYAGFVKNVDGAEHTYDLPLKSGQLALNSDLSAYRAASAQDSIDAAQDAAIAAKYTKPSGGIPASDLASGVIPTAPVLSVNGKTGAVVLAASDVGAATMADATLTEAAKAWVFHDGVLEVSCTILHVDPENHHLEFEDQPEPDTTNVYEFYVADASGSMVGSAIGAAMLLADNLRMQLVGAPDEITSIVGQGGILATRSSATGYQLGSQSDKPLAPAGDYALKSELPDVPVKAVKRNGTALVPDAQGAVDVEVPTSFDRIVSPNGLTSATARNDGSVVVSPATIAISGGFTGTIIGGVEPFVLPDPARFRPWTTHYGETWLVLEGASAGEFGTYSGFAIDVLDEGQAMLMYTVPGMDPGTQSDAYVIAYISGLDSGSPSIVPFQGDWEDPFEFDATVSMSSGGARLVAYADDIPRLSPPASGAQGKAADAKAAYDALDLKLDKADVVHPDTTAAIGKAAGAKATADLLANKVGTSGNQTINNGSLTVGTSVKSPVLQAGVASVNCLKISSHTMTYVDLYGNEKVLNIPIDRNNETLATTDDITQGTAVFRGSFATKAALDAVQWQTADPSGANFVSNNDYAVVLDDETHSDECWRYLYVVSSGSGSWTAQYRINESPLTQAQQDALNSGVTAAVVAKAESAVQPSALGTASSKNVPASGDASSTEVVLGSDTRLAAFSTWKSANPVVLGAVDVATAKPSGGVIIGSGAKIGGANYSNSIAIGNAAKVNALGSIAVGNDIAVSGQGSAQLGHSSTALTAQNTFRFRDTVVVNGNGKIPSANLDKEIPAVVAPSTSAADAGKAADAKATGDQLAGKLSTTGGTVNTLAVVHPITVGSVPNERTYGVNSISRGSNHIDFPSNTGVIALTSDIPVVVAPSTSATTGQAADAKATGDQLAGKLSRLEAGLSAWDISPTPQSSWSVQFESADGNHSDGWYLVIDGERVDFYEAIESETTLLFTDYTVTRTWLPTMADLASKQDVISDLAAIRSGAAAGASAVQPGQRNLLDYTTGTTLAPQTAVYRAALNADDTFPTVDATAIPTAAAYYCFELELAVPATVPPAIVGPTGWDWIDGHGLPDPADLSGGETIYISVRLDCTARTFLASVWRVA